MEPNCSTHQRPEDHPILSAGQLHQSNSCKEPQSNHKGPKGREDDCDDQGSLSSLRQPRGCLPSWEEVVYRTVHGVSSGREPSLEVVGWQWVRTGH